MRKSKSTPFFIIAGFVILGMLAHFSDDFLPAPTAKKEYVEAYLSPEAKERLLYGNETGGGHKHGVGAPCKSEFPANWSDEEIFNTVEFIAANDNLPWRLEGNGYRVTESKHDGVNVRVVINNENGYIVSAYPLNTPRNPCPKKSPANDR